MRAEKREIRMRQIEAVAYEMLNEVGYDGTSMLAVAKRAKASNETMYRWYGDKNGLFQSMVAVNADKVRAALDQLTHAGTPPMETLNQLAPILLEMLLSDRAIALNRAAAADPSGDLGRAIARGGRENVLPLMKAVMQRAVAEGDLCPPAEWDLGALFMHLLVGDQQIRRAIGVLNAPTAKDLAGQAERAMGHFLTLCSGSA